MKLVEDWKDAWRWWSVRGLIVLGTLPLVWVSLPPDAKALIPEEWKPWVFTTIALATLLGRLKDQSNVQRTDQRSG